MQGNQSSENNVFVTKKHDSFKAKSKITLVYQRVLCFKVKGEGISV